jgi:hypothetical protein
MFLPESDFTLLDEIFVPTAAGARIYPSVPGLQAETPFRSQKNNLANFIQIIQKFAFSQETR